MSFVSDYLVPVLTGAIFFSFLGWILFLIYYFLDKVGLWKTITFFILRQKFGKDYEPSEEIFEWCINAYNRKWRYKDVKRFVKYEDNGQATLYTFMLLQKLKPNERELIERGFEDDEEFTSIEEEDREQIQED